jgi:hypothetical protein
MNTDLNTAAVHSYKLAQQLVGHYTAFGARPDPVVLYGKQFYEYLTSDSPYDFDTLLQSLETVVTRTIAGVSAASCNHNASQNKKILEAAKRMESLMRSSGQYYHGNRMDIKLESFKASCLEPQQIIDQAYKELDAYAAFATMALNNDWSEDPHLKLVDFLNNINDELDDELARLTKKFECEQETQRIKKESELSKSLSAYSEAYLMDNATDNDDNLKSPEIEILTHVKKKKL